jgi:hypothetical protein
MVLLQRGGFGLLHTQNKIPKNTKKIAKNAKNNKKIIGCNDF